MQRLILLLSLLPLSVSAQYLIHGQVLDDTGSPLPGASVKFDGSQKGTTTNQNGDFQLSTTADTCKLIVSFIGFQTQQRSRALPLSEKLIITLTLGENQLEQVTVSTGYQVLSPRVNSDLHMAAARPHGNTRGTKARLD